VTRLLRDMKKRQLIPLDGATPRDSKSESSGSPSHIALPPRLEDDCCLGRPLPLFKGESQAEEFA